MVTHRRSVAAIGALVIGGAGSRATLVPIDYAIEQFFPPSGVERDTFDEYKEHFAKEDGQFVLFWEAEDGPSIRLCQDLGRAARLFEEVGLEDVQWFGDVEVTETGRWTEARLWPFTGCAMKPPSRTRRFETASKDTEPTSS